ncbi:unnamed protein product [Ambrosiozyma monospora]|uniref:Unnamed protein product n=1 Tax=Ambrosiozyma monospora TaxID=43982 RepID=A0ACB5TW04_AMBMO|nr:unnamed protein product [Ambrosiozyma monospora]
MNTILNQDLDELSNDSMVESLKACCRTVFSLVDYFREWFSARKRDKKYSGSAFSEEHYKIEKFLKNLPTELLALRTAQCNSYERAIFNLEQSYVSGKLSQNEFSTRIRKMYSEIDDLDSLHGVLKVFSTDSLNDKLLQFRYCDDWTVTHESLAALSELDNYQNSSGGNEDKLNSVTSLLKCLDDHCEYDQVLLKLKNFEGGQQQFKPSKDWVVSALQASIFSGKFEELTKWVGHAEEFPSINSIGSELSIYYEFAQGLITLHNNKLNDCNRHINSAMRSLGFALSLSKEISHIKITNYMLLLHCIYDFQCLVNIDSKRSFRSVLDLLRERSDNTPSEYKINWKTHSLRKSIEILHPSSIVRDHLSDTLVEASEILRKSGRLDMAAKNITTALSLGNSSSKVDLEFANLLWAQGEHAQALKMLQSLLNSNDSISDRNLIQLTYSSWLEDSAAGSYDQITNGYETVANTRGGDIQLISKAHYCLGRLLW